VIADSLVGLRFHVGCIPWDEPDTLRLLGDCPDHPRNRVHVASLNMDFGPGTGWPGWVSNAGDLNLGDANLDGARTSADII
jgi:hypothetical protein